MMTNTTNATDIFTTIAARDAAPAPRTFKRVKRWQIRYAGKGSRKLYTHALARTLVARLKRRGCDAYMAPFTLTVPA